ncbi:MAG: putative Fe-S cluster assembly protein SufT [Thiotrichales bacterium]|nr:putative Fe-S cluster assembly protein SufT [Thiotrichales bacterium]
MSVDQYSPYEPITLNRDCEAALIPTGTPVVLSEGSVVFITQALGGSYTVNVNGNLVRIGDQDADALGFEARQVDATVNKTLTGDGSVDEDEIWDQLRTCYDPEIPINIVELGLIYECTVNKTDDGNRVDILMTLTAPGCGMGQFLADDVKAKIANVDNVTEVNVELTFDPPWSQDMMSEAARLQTGMY